MFNMFEMGQQFQDSLVRFAVALGEPRAFLIRTEVYVSFISGVLLLLAIFWSNRRRSSNWFLHKGFFVAYTFSFSLITFTLGLVQSDAVKSSMYPVWAISLIMLHGSTDTLSAYSLDESEQLTRLKYQAVMYFAYSVLLLSGSIVQLTYIALITFSRYALIKSAHKQSSKSCYSSKIVADYMYDQQNKSVSDPDTMEG
ncbi:hypothetical protein ACUV84_001312 [Puccinellia chinampoensis]